MHLRDWLRVALLGGAGAVETIWAREGEPVVIRCTRSGDMIRFEEPNQVLAIKFTDSEATYLAPRASVWKLDQSNRKTEHALILRIEKMTAETATSLSCVDEEGSQLDYRVRLLEPPKVQVSLNSAAELVQGDLLKATCEVTGGAPAASISWSNTISDSNFETSLSQGQSLSATAPPVTKSTLTYKVGATFHKQRFVCNVNQANSTTQFELPEVYVEYKPRNVQFSVNAESDENKLLEKPTCTADSYPAAKITYQISSNQQDWREFKPEVTKVTYNQHKSFIRCRAGNTQGSIFSEAQQLKIFRQETPVVFTTSQSSPVTKPTQGPPPQNDSGPSQLATQVEKSGKNGIILSVIGSAAFLLVVLFGIVLRRFVKRGQGQTYKTDELSELDEGISLHDPELEAHKKKEYFM